MSAAALPVVIQGGMGIGVSSWRLARAVAMCGQLGVVSGTALDTVLVRRLQDGDPGGHVRRAMAAFPWPRVVQHVLDRYFLPGGRARDQSYALLPMYRQVVSRLRREITVLANFVEVFLAREGHGGQIGVNLLAKVQLPTLHSLYGALLAGVNYVLMGAGIPREIPGALDRLAAHEPATMRLNVAGPAGAEPERLEFDPRAHWPATTALPELKRPRFLPIVSSHSLATMLARKANGRVNGFVVEGPTAGGHNAPPRGGARDEHGQPVYGERDVVDLAALRALGVPFWLAGGTGSPAALRAAHAQGAAGVQVGTLFAYARESGLHAALRQRILERVRDGSIDIRTDPLASPTGYPFKVVQLAGSNSDPDLYAARERICDLGYLRVPFRRADGRLDYRCAAEPVNAYIRKGGAAEDTTGRRCLCNALMADINLAQVRDGETERPLVTSGNALRDLAGFMGDRTDYCAADVVRYLLGG